MSKYKEPTQSRNERIQTLGGFGRKRTQVVQDKTKYNRSKEKASRRDLPSYFF